jgi:hypothetical protein
LFATEERHQSSPGVGLWHPSPEQHHHSRENGSGGAAMTLDSTTVNVTVTNNVIFKWENGIVNRGSGNTLAPNTIDLVGTSGASFPNPIRSLGSYYGSIGGSPATTAGFIAPARQQRKDNWYPALLASAVNNYIRAGFGR